MPPKVPNPSIPPCDPSLWLVHYTKAEQRDQIPAASIPVVQGVQIIQSQRKALQSLGQLPRKEFMLHDKSNYPTINLPPGLNAQNFPHPNFFVRQQQQQQGLIGQQGVPVPGGIGPAPNRGVPSRPGSHVPRQSITSVEPSIEEEEDVSRGDLLDFMTPRDISKVRYEQHHEWMEEIVASPFATKQIVPTDLGLGRMGELEALTRGFFESPSGPQGQSAASDELLGTRVGKMDAGKAEEFTKLASQKVSELTAELESLKQRHARRMAKLQKSGILTTAERRLWKAAPGKLEKGEVFDYTETVDGIVREVEAAWGQQIGVIEDITCVEKGGLEELTLSGTYGDVDGNDQMKLDLNGDSVTNHTADVQMAQADSISDSGPQSHSQPVSRHSSPSRQSNLQVSINELPRSEPSVPSPAPGEELPPIEQHQQQTAQEFPPIEDNDVDIEMTGLAEDTAPAEEPAISAPDDWVLVPADTPKFASSPQPSLDQPQTQTQIQTASPQIQHDAKPSDTLPQSPITALDTSTPAPQTSAEPSGMTPASASERPEATPKPITPIAITNEFDIGTNFDSAGDALDAYGAENDGTGLDLDDMGMADLDDSAFGEAFQPEAS